MKASIAHRIKGRSRFVYEDTLKKEDLEEAKKKDDLNIEKVAEEAEEKEEENK